jgi:hypothetical protein
MKALAARVAARKSGLDARTTRSPGRKAAGGTTATAVLEADADLEADEDVAASDPTDTAATANLDTPAAATGPRGQPRKQQSRNKRKR